MAQVKKEVFVWDFTFMNHLLRVHLGLSANEYIYMDMVARLANQHGGYTGLSNKSAAQAVGVSISTIKIFIETLTKKGLLESKDSCIGDCVPKRGSALWWECYNKLLPKNENSTTPTSNLNRGSQNLTTPNKKTTTRKLKLPSLSKKTATIDNPIVNTINNNTFSKEKDISVFSEKNLKSENQPQPQAIEPEKKEKEKKVAPKKEKDGTEDFLELGSLPAYLSKDELTLRGISSTLWGVFIIAITKRHNRKRLPRGQFELWIKDLEIAAANWSEEILTIHLRNYEFATWSKPFFPKYTEVLQGIAKDLKTNQSTTQNNNQNGKNKPNNSNISQQQTAEYLAQQQRPDF